MWLFFSIELLYIQSEARHTIQESLQSLNLGRTECAVRINSMDSGLAEEDLKVIFSGEKTPQTILLPKVETKEHLDSVINNKYRLFVKYFSNQMILFSVLREISQSFGQKKDWN